MTERLSHSSRGRRAALAEADLVGALDDTDEDVQGLQLYAECELLKAGWRLEHPAVRGVLPPRPATGSIYPQWTETR